ncbi:MAG: TIGR00341 family protein [Bacteroidia bacterium]
MLSRRIARFIFNLLRRFDLSGEKDTPENILQRIRAGVEFRGINLWVLITAIIVASVGLNVNSTAVIIGAMLISPLMGPIIGVGVSLAVYDFKLFFRSLRNLAYATGVSILTSSLYFLLSPIKDPGNELVARTEPTFWDVLIAFFGGLSGIIAATSRERNTNVIAGVAIATALMPPLCTVGYGIGTGQTDFFLGAFYLYLINAVFISLSAYLLARALQLPEVTFLDPLRKRRVHLGIYTLVILVFTPSLYLAYRLVTKVVLQKNLQRFIQTEVESPYTHVLKWSTEGKKLSVVLVGEALTQKDKEILQTKLPRYELEGWKVEIIQATPQTTSRESDTWLRVFEEEKKLVRNLQEELEKCEQKIEQCQKRVEKHEKNLAARQSLTQEAQALFPEITQMGVAVMTYYEKGKMLPDTTWVIDLRTRGPLKETQRLHNWLKTKLGTERIFFLPQKR